MNDQIIEKINALVKAKYFRPEGSELYYWGKDFLMDHTWMLDGMTPVHADYVLGRLEKDGCDLSEIKALMSAQSA